MKRLTRPNISVDKDTDRYLNAKIGEREFEWSTASDRVIDLILNGPALMGFSKDVLRKIIRELYVRLKPYEDLGLEPWQADAAKSIVEMAFEDKPERAERILDLMRADRDGRVVVLPCKDWMDIVFGEQVLFWGIDTDYIENPIREISVDNAERISWYDGWKTVFLKGTDENGEAWEFYPDEIGKTVFLSHEEAEKALEAMKNG